MREVVKWHYVKEFVEIIIIILSNLKKKNKIKIKILKNKQKDVHTYLQKTLRNFGVKLIN